MGNNQFPKLNKLTNEKGVYYKKILLGVFTALMTVVLLLSTLILSFTKKRIRANNERIDDIMLRHMQTTTEYLYNSAKNTCNQIYATKNAKMLFYCTAPKDGNEMYEAIKQINGIQSTLIDVEGVVDSFSIYSAMAQRLYSSRNGLDYADSYLEQAIANGQVDTHKPVLRMMQNASGRYRSKVLTFSVTDIDSDKNIIAGVFVNINVSWLQQKLNMLLSEKNLQDECVLILNDKGGIVTSVGDSAFTQDAFVERLHEKYNDREHSSLVKENFNGIKCYISTIPLAKQDMLIIRIQHAESVNREYYSFLKIALLLVLLCVVLSFFLAWLITYILYKPIDSLWNKASRLNGLSFSQKDEIAFLNQTFDSIGNTQEALLDSQKRITLYELLCEIPTEEQNVEEYTHLTNLNVNPYQPMMLVIVYIDNDEMYDQSEYALQLSEMITEGCQAEIIRLDVRKVVCIIQTENESARQAFLQKLWLICEREMLWQTYSLVASNLIADMSHLTEAYAQTVDILQRRYFCGDRAVMTAADIHVGGTDVWGAQAGIFSAEEKLLETVRQRAGNMRIEQTLDDYLNLMRDFEYSDMGVLRSHLIQSIRNLLAQMNKLRTIQITPDLRGLDAAIFNTSNIHQLKQVVLHFLIELSNDLGMDKEDKYVDLVELIKKNIESKYPDKGLCLSTLCDMVNLSQNYVGRIFKERTGMSVSAYITDVRLSNAAKLIERGNLKMSTISDQVGFTNQSSFYKSFKQKYSVTPKDYIVIIRNTTDDKLSK